MPGVAEFYRIGVWIIPVTVFVIVGMSNAVNLTDGIDSLAGSDASIAFACYGFIAFLQDQVYLVAFCFTLVGAILAFLWYNAHPAQMFMGDTGSLAVGSDACARCDHDRPVVVCCRSSALSLSP